MENKIQINKLELESGEPLLIAGPCSAESRSQVLQTAQALSGLGVFALRAGIWKPRTKPGGYEGPGSVGLEWLVEAGRRTGMRTCTEVANAEHLHSALEAGVDMLWVGARTTADPFAVQALADALHNAVIDGKAKDIILLVKNPVNPDVELWSGAVERFYNAGINKIGLVHRGFSTYDTGIYRNAPLWNIPIEMKRRFPDITMICDPSHMGGSRKLVQPISQQALDLMYDGLMIECHINPEEALSDKAQQISPSELKQILGQLRVRENKIPEGNIDLLRSEIDRLDDRLMEVLAQRMDVSKRIGFYKQQNNMPVLQSQRYGEIVEKLKEKADSLGLSREFASSLMEIIHNESVRVQMDQRGD